MMDNQLFLGLAVTPTFQSHLEQVPEQLRSHFIHPDYLQTVEHQGVKYLGKSLGSLIDFSSVELSQTHIQSLLRRLNIDEAPLVLLVT